MRKEIISKNLQEAAKDIILKVAKKIHIEKGLSIEESKNLAYEISMPVIKQLFI